MTRLSRRDLLGGGLAFTAVSLFSRGAVAMTSPTQRKAAVLARALSYERTLPERSGSMVDVLMVHSGGASKSEALGWEAAFASLNSVKVAGKSLVSYSVALGPDLGSALDSGGVDVVIACGNTASAVTKQLASMTAAAKVLSVGTRRSQVEQALTFGVIDEDSKLRMLINLRSAKREGVRFSSKLLKLAEVIR